MAGANKVIKPGQVLFKAGDKPDGMYLVRKGELRVYLEQNGKEVTLVTIGDGGMIGEMALFDQQPRSASVKATKDTEVTLISLIDFEKLMKQIPKWFVGLMVALSGRLRQTNERLQKLEAGISSTGRPFLPTIRLMSSLDLLWHKFGAKEGKETLLTKDVIHQHMVDLLQEDPEKILSLMEILTREQIISQKVDTYKKVAYSLNNRGFFSSFLGFIAEYTRLNSANRCLGVDALHMVKIAIALADRTAYDTATLSFEELVEEARKEAINTAKWKEALPQLKAAGDAVKLAKTSGGLGLGIRVVKKDAAAFLKNHRIAADLHKANLS